jgi:putative membrane protein
MMSWYGSGGWDWVWMAAMMLLFWGGVMILAVWAIRSFAGSRGTRDAAFDVLRRRLASGEITLEDFEKARKVLGA